MYSSRLVAIRRGQLERLLHAELPRGLREYSVPEVLEYQDRMKDLWGKKGEQLRPLSVEEERFIQNEQLLSKVDFEYFASRYITINLAGQTLGLLYPLWESQRLIIAEIGRIEWDRYQTNYPDGVIINVLKDRQTGVTTLSESIIFHRLVTHSHVFGLLASDVPDSSDFLWDMFERMLDHLPWYMRPMTLERVKNDEIVFGTESRLFWGASKSTRGADKPERSSSAGQKGQLGRGRTVSVAHLSELATWTNPAQIDSALEPAIPRTPFSFWLRESTANGRGKSNWWWMEWQLGKSGKGRAANIFIPWYAEATRHHLPALLSWAPNADTLAHARRAEEHGPRWLHRTVNLTRDQLYWYETSRDQAIAKDKLEDFLQEHPADDEEAFQYSSKSVFPLMLRERIKNQARPMTGMIEVVPHRELVHG